MNARFQRRIQRYGWDKAAPHYEIGWKHSLAPAQQKLLELAAPEPGNIALDMACGTGLVTFPIADAVGPSGQVVATDLSEKMVESLRCEADRRETTNVEAFRADAEALPVLVDNAFDIVTCALGLMYCPAPEKAMCEALRVLKPGGRAIFAVWGARNSCGWAEVFPIVDAKVHSTVCPLFFRLGSGDILMREMSVVGFENLEQVRLSTLLYYRDENAAVNAAFAGGPVALAYDRFDETTRETVRADYLASISRFKVPTGYRIPGEFVVCRGYKTLV